MGSRHFENKAYRAFWSVHIEAWRQSGLSRAGYCREHRLTVATFDRWLKETGDVKALAHLVKPKPRRGNSPLCPSKRSAAVQAFWAMHVEALNWSGLTAKHYAAAHSLSADTLRRWRGMIAAGEVAIDWRTRLHPSALPKISSDISSAAKGCSPETLLTDEPAADPPRDGRSHRRRFSETEKRAIAAECDLPGATAAEVCRRHAIVTSMLFRWRVQFGYGRKEDVRIASVRSNRHSAEALVLQDLLPAPLGMAVFVLPDGRRVFAPAGADPDAVRRHVAEQEMAR